MSRPTISSVPGNVEHLDPNTVEIGENIREAVDLNKDFLDSLREYGVLVPLSAVEEVITNGRSPDEVYREVAAAA